MRIVIACGWLTAVSCESGDGRCDAAIEQGRTDLRCQDVTGCAVMTGGYRNGVHGCGMYATYGCRPRGRFGWFSGYACELLDAPSKSRAADEDLSVSDGGLRK